MPKPSEIFDTPAATGFSRVRENEEIIAKIDGANVAGGDIHSGLHNAINHVFFAIKPEEFEISRNEVFAEVREIIRTILTTKDQEKEEEIRVERARIVEIIKDELRNSPLEVQMTKGIIFANVINRIEALPTEDNN